MGERLDAQFGPAIALKGYTLEPPAKAGDELRLTLYWQAAERVTGQYKVFIHVVDGSGRMVAQQDSLPASGAAPTQSWLAGEVIADEHAFVLPESGLVRVLAGLYDPASGQRLPIQAQGERPVESDALQLGELDIR